MAKLKLPANVAVLINNNLKTDKMNKIEFILQENVLTDNVLQIPVKGFIFKGGYIAKITEYTFLNAWNDKEHIRLFRNKKRLFDYLFKKYPDFYFETDNTCLE